MDTEFTQMVRNSPGPYGIHPEKIQNFSSRSFVRIKGFTTVLVQRDEKKAKEK